MTTSENSSETPLMQALQPSKKFPHWIIWGFVIISFLGFLDASYLTIEHFSGGYLNCYLLTGCNDVLTSKYSEIFGIPTALFGAIYYLTILVLSLLYVDTRHKKLLWIIPLLTIFGLLASAIFVYLMEFVIKALCSYCLFSALTSTLLFVFGMILLRGRKLLS